MGETRHDFGLYVGLNIWPGLAILWGAGRQQSTEVARFDVGKDAPLVDGIVILDDCSGVDK